MSKVKKVGVILLTLILAGAIICLLFETGILRLPELETIGENEGTVSVISTVSELSEGCYYVWHDSDGTLEEDLLEANHKSSFYLCPAGEKNWEENVWVNHTVWFTSKNDDEIPTLYEGDALIYVSSTSIPHKGISFERMADYGYTIGVSNLTKDESGHYYIVQDSDCGYDGYLYLLSDAGQLSSYTNVSELFLDKVGEIKVREDTVSSGGTVMGLEKDESYVCEWYTGSFYQDFLLTAGIHPFCLLESFTTYDYEFLHSNCISITLPDYLKSGYYYVEGTGLFRYVAKTEEASYNRMAFDAGIDWNDPIILYDENGFVVYDPTRGYGSEEKEEDAESSTNTQEVLGKDGGDSGLPESYTFNETIIDEKDIISEGRGNE